MPVLPLIILTIVGYLIGTALLFASMRFVAKADFSFGRAAGVYLAMVVSGSVVLWVAIYVSSEIGHLHAVPCLALSMFLSTLSECFVGYCLTRRSTARALLAVSLPVILLNLVGFFGLWPATANAEKKTTQIIAMNDLRQTYMALQSMLQGQAGPLPLPASLNEFESNPMFNFFRIKVTNFDYLPEHLARAGVTGPYDSELMPPTSPLLWVKTTGDDDVPVVYSDGSGSIVKQTELDAQINSAIKDIRLKRSAQ